MPNWAKITWVAEGPSNCKPTAQDLDDLGNSIRTWGYSLTPGTVSVNGNQNILTNLGRMEVMGSVAVRMTGSGFKYIDSEGQHVAFTRKAGGFAFYFRRSDNGRNDGLNLTNMLTLEDTQNTSHTPFLVAGACKVTNPLGILLDENDAGWSYYRYSTSTGATKLMVGCGSLSSYIQSAAQGQSWDTRPLVLQPNGGYITIPGKRNYIGSTGGASAISPLSQSDANIVLYGDAAGTGQNWAGLGVDGSGNFWIRTGLSGTHAARLLIDTNGQVITAGPSLAETAAMSGSSTFSISHETGADRNRRLMFGLDAIAGTAWIQAIHIGAAYYPLLLNPNGNANVVIGAGQWNTSHLQLGPWHFWVDGSGRLRTKGSAPVSDVDGTIVGTQS